MMFEEQGPYLPQNQRSWIVMDIFLLNLLFDLVIIFHIGSCCNNLIYALYLQLLNMFTVPLI